MASKVGTAGKAVAGIIVIEEDGIVIGEEDGTDIVKGIKVNDLVVKAIKDKGAKEEGTRDFRGHNVSLDSMEANFEVINIDFQGHIEAIIIIRRAYYYVGAVKVI